VTAIAAEQESLKGFAAGIGRATAEGTFVTTKASSNELPGPIEGEVRELDD
jgi:hypothetical protein